MLKAVCFIQFIRLICRQPSVFLVLLCLFLTCFFFNLYMPTCTVPCWFPRIGLIFILFSEIFRFLTFTLRAVRYFIPLRRILFLCVLIILTVLLFTINLKMYTSISLPLESFLSLFLTMFYGTTL